MNNPRSLLRMRGKDRIPSARVKGLCGVEKRVDERTDESVLQWFGNTERTDW